PYPDRSRWRSTSGHRPSRWSAKCARPVLRAMTNPVRERGLSTGGFPARSRRAVFPARPSGPGRQGREIEASLRPLPGARANRAAPAVSFGGSCGQRPVIIRPIPNAPPTTPDKDLSLCPGCPCFRAKPGLHCRETALERMNLVGLLKVLVLLQLYLLVHAA